jgi:hypothetical protein
MNEYRKKLNSLAKEIMIGVAENKLTTESREFKLALEIIKELNEETEPDYIITTAFHSGTKPDMFQHIIAVVELIAKQKKSFSEACNIRAKQKGVNSSSVRQACCRAMNISADVWNRFASGDSVPLHFIVRKLIEKYPGYKKDIFNAFEIKYE